MNMFVNNDGSLLQHFNYSKREGVDEQGPTTQEFGTSYMHETKAFNV